jgi:Uma2 family endonuclease
MGGTLTLETVKIVMPRDSFTFYWRRSKPSIEDFTKICQQNPEMRFEMNKEGEISAMPPVHSDTSEKNADVVYS